FRAFPFRTALAHLKLASAVLERHFIHQLVDQKDSPSAGLEHVLADQRVGHRRCVESRARIADDDEYFAVAVAVDDALHLTRSVSLAAMAYRVGQRFLQRELDLDDPLLGP